VRAECLLRVEKIGPTRLALIREVLAEHGYELRADS
jgi:hypothetical protein